ncbi:uncharacterized protein H6S33_005191 [Morchella sextelata]|uniref:uncharacterized protein n=1 Tax=Morchella sextelata TaxID=1174677 RepID=UPI001D05491F|nr:uncharacterized protein H6S33_005191 [Morchella sextelata]KAH0605209.1 hypothetical protein H6S33_005191 [Morchella sextelata]
MQPTAPLHRAIRRLALTTKMVNGGYYKGTRTGSMGTHTRRGGFVVDYSKVRTYVVPGLEGFKLTPFVTRKMAPTVGAERYSGASPMSGGLYLERWKRENGVN